MEQRDEFWPLLRPQQELLDYCLEDQCLVLIALFGG